MDFFKSLDSKPALGFPEANSFFAMNVQRLFHLNICFFILVISIISTMFFEICYHFSTISPKPIFDLEAVNENWVVETLFVIFPFLIVICLAFPSFSLLYSLSEIHKPKVIVKITAHQ